MLTMILPKRLDEFSVPLKREVLLLKHSSSVTL
jgi:hypothetical protein